MREFLTLHEAADFLGVHYMTAYRYVRLGQLAAHKEAGTWRVAQSDLLLFQQANANKSSEPVSVKNGRWCERLENRLQEADASGAWKVVEAALTSGMSPLDVYADVLIPTLRSVGERWQAGELTVADEHQASALVARIIGRLSPRFSRRGRRKGTVVVAGPAGERHSLNLAMVADVLCGGGYSVVDLGSDLPAGDFQACLSRHRPVAGVCLGVLNPDALDSCREMVLAARRVVDPSVPVIVGGSAIEDDSHALRLGADRTADLRTVVEAVETGRDAPTTVSV